MTIAIDVPLDGAYFRGHFPGRPILPGVAELDLVVAALARGPLAGIPFARFRRTVGPGERLELDARDASAERVRITLRRGDEIVMNGELAFGPLPPSPPVAAQANARVETPPLHALLPHQPPMRFVTAVAAETADGADCLAVVPGGCGLVTAGTAPALAVLEAAAQTAAVWEALRRSRSSDGSGPRMGYLVTLRDVALHRTRVPADTPLVASVRLVEAAMPLTHYRAQVVLDGGAVTTGLVSTVLA